MFVSDTSMIPFLFILVIEVAKEFLPDFALEEIVFFLSFKKSENPKKLTCNN